MKYKRALTQLILLFLVLTVSMSIIFSAKIPFHLPRSSIPHDRIEIASNSELDTFCTGDGTDGLSWETAHVIENYEIETSSNFDHAISISNTDRYLIIQQCTLKCSGSYASPISLYNCENVNCTQNVITEGGVTDSGISLRNCRFNFIKDNEIGNVASGIYIWWLSINNTVVGNTITDARNAIVNIDNAHNNTISNNDGNTDGPYGINLVEGSSGNEIFGNCFKGGADFLAMVNDRGTDNNVYDNKCGIIPGFPVGVLLISIVGTAVLILLLNKKLFKS